jgi:TRAP-type C4-dicarboxylate transport system permease small subunit
MKTILILLFYFLMFSCAAITGIIGIEYFLLDGQKNQWSIIIKHMPIENLKYIAGALLICGLGTAIYSLGRLFKIYPLRSDELTIVKTWKE